MNKVSITINDTRYDSVEDNDDDIDICKRCAMHDYCCRLDGAVICSAFCLKTNERFKVIKDIIKDNPENKGYIKVQIEFVDGSSRTYKTRQRNMVGVLELMADKDYLVLDNIDGYAEIINISNIKTIREAKFV